MQPSNKHRWNTWSTILGFAVWLTAIFVYPTSTYIDQIKLLIFFGIAVIAPLALGILTPIIGQWKLHTLAVYFQPVAAVLSGLSLLTPIGVAAGALAASWLALTGILGLLMLLANPFVVLTRCGLSPPLHCMERGPGGEVRGSPTAPLLGLTRLRASQNSLAELCITMAFLYAPVSGIWLVIYQTWGSFLKFDATIVLLTAAHFCFISLGALLITGMAGRRISHTRSLYRVAAVGAILSPAIVAAGITLTSFGGSVSPIEVIGVVGLAGSILLLSILVLFAVRPRIENRVARWLITASAASLFLTMGLALAYSIGRSTNWWDIAIPDMVQWHGWFNAIGFTFLGLVAWRIEILT